MVQAFLSKTKYHSEIDGLRAFAVLSVVAFHAFPDLFIGGFIGVDIFFVISGFLITSHIFESLDKGQFSFTDFFGRRIRRIFPALIVVMFFSLIFGWFSLLGEELSQLGKHIASGSAFIINFILVNESGYFDAAAETKPMLHLWSLAVEEQFYIIWPLVLWISWKLKFNLLIVTILIGLFSFYINLNFVKAYPTEIFFWSLGRFWELLSGSVLAWFFLYKAESLTRIRLVSDKYILQTIGINNTVIKNSVISNLSSLFGLTLLIYGVFYINESLPFPSTWALIPVLGAILLISSGSKAWLSRIFLMNPIAIWIGLISYPLYLWHWPILSYIQIIDGEFPHRDARILAVIFSIFLAWLTYKFIENPIRFGVLKKKINAISIAMILFGIGFFGYIVSVSETVKSRNFNDLAITRTDEYLIGNSFRWFEGKEKILFLGNAHSEIIRKLVSDKQPDESEIEKENKPIKFLADSASKFGTKIALFVGPNKSSIYSELLPNNVNPSKERYLDFFIKDLENYPNLIVHDPTEDLIKSKNNEGMLYFKTGTHYNNKGAYLALKGLIEKLNIIPPKIVFFLDELNTDDVEKDLLKMSGLKNFPISSNENWKFSFENTNFELNFLDIPKTESSTAFGEREIVINSNPIIDKKIWVAGDSFNERLRPFLNRIFSEVHYIGHIRHKLDILPELLIETSDKPDLVLLVQVERSF